MVQGTQTVASFTGTLLKREHTVGQKIVQLVFRENGKNWLCISTNPRTAKLDVGQTYHIQGSFKSVGEREYIHEPRITPVRSRGAKVKRMAVYTAVVLVVATMTAFAVRLVGGFRSTSAEIVRNQQPANTAEVLKVATTDTEAQTPAAETPAPTPAPVPKPVAKKTTKPVVTTASAAVTTTPTTISNATPIDDTPPPPVTEDNPGTGTPPAGTEATLPTEEPQDPPAATVDETPVL